MWSEKVEFQLASLPLGFVRGGLQLRVRFMREALGMLDYYMKGFVNGYYFEKDFIENCGQIYSKSI